MYGITDEISLSCGDLIRVYRVIATEEGRISINFLLPVSCPLAKLDGRKTKASFANCSTLADAGMAFTVSAVRRTVTCCKHRRGCRDVAGISIARYAVSPSLTEDVIGTIPVACPFSARKRLKICRHAPRQCRLSYQIRCVIMM